MTQRSRAASTFYLLADISALVHFNPAFTEEIYGRE